MTMVLSAHAAEGLADKVPRIKPSIVAVGTYLPTRNPAFSFRGTGFVVGDGLLVATNAHVLPEGLDAGQSEVLAIARADEGGRINVRSATVFAKDPTHDLAVLRLTGGGPLPALVLEDGFAVREGDDVGFMGFPLGAILGLRPVTHRGMISAITPIGSPPARAQDLSANLIRRLATGFDVLQLDATAYPGNSGSPVFDANTGTVIGIVNMVFVKGAKENAITQPSGITYAIPARYLRSLLGERKE
ncbi:MAG: trypsin-like peptidase domain-containing protein [Bdellovibrionales bacterium]|nr:trypsin-like peptidase domain-containing protein [Bdellovibrionales bacterium]